MANKSKESIVSNSIRNLLKNKGIDWCEQNYYATNKVEKLLKDSLSKSGNIGGNRPDFNFFVGKNKSYLFIIEAKGFANKMVKKDINGFISEDEKDVINKAITFTTAGTYHGTFFYQNEPFVLENNVCAISVSFNDKVCLYITALLQKQRQRVGYGSTSQNTVKNMEISLPINDLNEIDFDYMQERIEELEQERIEELEQYLIATGLNNYELTNEDIKTLSLFGLKHYKEFKVSKNHNEIGLFDCFRGTRFTKANRIDGNIPLLTASIGLGEGVAQNIQETNKLVKYSNDITIDMLGLCFYHDYEHYGDDNIHFLVNDTIPEKAKLFITQSLQKQLSGQVYYGRQFRMNLLEKLFVSLPIQTDTEGSPIIDTDHKYHPNGYIPDWDFMGKYIGAIEKIVIADVVKYKDEVIATTKKVL